MRKSIIAIVVICITICAITTALGDIFGHTASETGDGIGQYGRAFTCTNYRLAVTQNIVIDSLCIRARYATEQYTVGISVYTWRNGLPVTQLAERRCPTITSGSYTWMAVACTISVSAPDTIVLAYGNPQPKYSAVRISKKDSSGIVMSGDADSLITTTWVHNFNSAQVWNIYAVYHVASSPQSNSAMMRKKKIIGF